MLNPQRDSIAGKALLSHKVVYQISSPQRNASVFPLLPFSEKSVFFSHQHQGILQRHMTMYQGQEEPACACVLESLQSCPALCDPMDCSLPGSFVHGIFQARTLEWVAMPFSRGSSWPRDQTHVSYFSCIGRRFFTTRTTKKSLLYIKWVPWFLLKHIHTFKTHLKDKGESNQKRTQLT